MIEAGRTSSFPLAAILSNRVQYLAVIGSVALGLVIAVVPVPVGVMIGFITTAVILTCITPIAGLAVLLILAPLRTLIATESSFQLPLDIGQITLIAVLSTYFAGRVASHRRLLQETWTSITTPLILFIVVAGLSVFNSVSLSAWLNEWVKWLQILALSIWVCEIARGNRWRWIVLALVFSGIANALIGMYQFFGGSGALHLVVGDRFFRAFGTFGQPNPFGGFIGLLLPISMMMALAHAQGLLKTSVSNPHHLRKGGLALIYGLASVVMLVAIGMSWSRGAWLGLAGAFGVIALTLPRQRKWGLLLVGGAVVAFAAGWYFDLIPSSLIQRLSSSTQELFAFEDVRGIDITPENFAIAERLAHWQAALNMATDQPFVGVGLGHYEVVYGQYRLINWSEALGHAHNTYLNLLAELGIIGLLVYGKAWLLIIWLNWRSTQHPDVVARFAAVGLLGTWTYLHIHSLFDNLYVNNVFIHLGVMLGILAVLNDQLRSNVKVATP
ncbi:MAG: O-antigen ligase family protein [Anaerolineae bacterium]|nr:O-antigen ligase family protein [Anaerolineae bacterium]